MFFYLTIARLTDSLDYMITLFCFAINNQTKISFSFSEHQTLKGTYAGSRDPNVVFDYQE